MTLIEIKVLPNRKTNRIVKMSNDGLFRIELKAKPIEDRANIELVKFLSKILDIPQNQISIIRGMHSTYKVIKIDSISKNLVIEKINKKIQSL